MKTSKPLEVGLNNHDYDHDEKMLCPFEKKERTVQVYQGHSFCGGMNMYICKKCKGKWM
jgi:hypothetical protein